MGAAEDAPVGLHPVADDPAAAVSADWCQGVDGALEAVEDMCRSSCLHLERLVVVVPADLTDRHESSFPSGECGPANPLPTYEPKESRAAQKPPFRKRSGPAW